MSPLSFRAVDHTDQSKSMGPEPKNDTSHNETNHQTLMIAKKTANKYLKVKKDQKLPTTVNKERKLQMKEKITVVGGSGFVGTNLCSILEQSKIDFEIIDLHPSKKFESKTKIADVRDINSLRENITGDIVINLAAIHTDNVKFKEEYHNTNVKGADNITKICTEKKIKKIIFTSSVAVYGFTTAPTDENGTINPFNEYGKSKFEAEEVYRTWQKLNKNQLIIIRPTVIFGKGNRGNFYNLLKQISERKFLMIGSGKNKKSLAYIENVVAFLVHCIYSNKEYGLYNYVDTPSMSMNELVKHIRTRLFNKPTIGIRIPKWLGMLVGYIADLVSNLTNRHFVISSVRIEKFTSPSDFKSAKKNLDAFNAPISLIDGINKTIDDEFISPDQNQIIFYTE